MENKIIKTSSVYLILFTKLVSYRKYSILLINFSFSACKGILT